MRKKFCIGVLLTCLFSAGSASALSAQPGNIKITWETQEITPARYMISGENYVGLRSLAGALSGTDAQFDVDYQNRQIFVIPEQAYIASDTAIETPQETAQEATKSNFSIACKDTTYQPAAYVINGHTYYRLRDLADILNFSVDYDTQTRTAMLAALPKSPEFTSDPESEHTAPDTTLPPAPELPPESEQAPNPTLPPTPTLPSENEQIPNTPTPEGTPPPPQNPTVPEARAIDGVLTILLDAGHGGPEPGSSAIDGTIEAVVNMDVTALVRDYLQAEGVVVHMIRDENDTTMTNTVRNKLITEYAQTYPLDLLFSIHHNSVNGTATGSELMVQIAYEKGGLGQELAQSVESEYRKMGRKIRPTKYLRSESDPTKDRLFVLKTAWQNNLLCVMSEFCFLDNAEDFVWIQNAEGRAAEARAIADGILAYYKTHPY